MGRKMDIFIGLAVAVLLLTGLSLIALHWPEIAAPAPRADMRFRRVPVALIVTPLLVGASWLWAKRRLARSSLTPSAEMMRLFDGVMVAAVLIILAMHAVFAYGLATGVFPGRGLMLRAAMICAGALWAVYGNYLAKVAPPTGPDAPAPELWTRHMLRYGWVVSLTGVAIMVSAVAGFQPRWVFTTAALVLIVNHAARRKALGRAGASLPG